MIKRRVKLLISAIADFNSKYIAVLLCSLIIIGVLLELSRLTDWWDIGKSYAFPILTIIVSTLFLVSVIAALLQRLLDVVEHNRPARNSDLMLIGFLYIYAIGAFGCVFLASESLSGKEAFHVSAFPSTIRLMDALYLSGITIATVGYGDVTPTYGFTKALAVIESLLGLGLTAIVAGFFIGSLLSRKQYDRQSRWFAGLQRVYFLALEKCQKVIGSGGALNLEDCVTFEKTLLDAIAVLVKEQFGAAPSTEVRANWMQFYAAVEAPAKAIQLAKQYTHPVMRKEKAMRTLAGILVMREWNDKPKAMPGRDEFALPVYDHADPEQSKFQLAGAPQAIGETDGYVVISDSRDINLNNQHKSVREALEKYFKIHEPQLKSFASLRMDDNGKILGIINIQSTEIELCGATPEQQRIIVDMLGPFARYLAGVIQKCEKM